MKIKRMAAVILSLTLIFGISITAFAKEEAQENAKTLESAKMPENGSDVLRNEQFTSTEQMGQLMGTSSKGEWSMMYLPEVEQYYWNFCEDGKQDCIELNMNLVSNSYLNLEMFLDNGYLLDYSVLKDYAENYLSRKGYPDTYYMVLTDCLKNPYLLNKPAAQVTDLTYNGRDYSAVFDPDFYYDSNPDLQGTIGFNPPELLRQFVEKGIMEGRSGKAGVDIKAYIASVDAEIAASKVGLKAPGTAPAIAKFSYSPANYYGKLLGHYDYSSYFEEEGAGELDIASKQNVANGVDSIPASKENGVDW